MYPVEENMRTDYKEYKIINTVTHTYIIIAVYSLDLPTGFE
jgi:hypothetical protein